MHYIFLCINLKRTWNVWVGVGEGMHMSSLDINILCTHTNKGSISSRHVSLSRFRANAYPLNKIYRQILVRDKLFHE